MDHDETGCHPAPEGPILCVNNCGFFGSSANMNMCSKCYKDMVLNREQAMFAASSIENSVNRSSSGVGKETSVTTSMQADLLEVKVGVVEGLDVASGTTTPCEPKSNETGPKRCMTCKKRVGLTGFTCRCGYVFCGSHRYSDKHNCSFDYRSAGQDAIAKANPVVKADKICRI